MERTQRVQIWRDVTGRKLDKAAELANTYDMPLAVSPNRAAEKPTTIRKTAGLNPHVNVTGKEAPVQVLEKKAQHYALPSQERYPLDSYTQVKEAAAYFLNTFAFMLPADRHEYCQNLTKRANALGLFVDPLIEKYGSSGYAEDWEIELAIEGRRASLTEPTLIGLLDKVAEQREVLPPEDFACVLGEFDKLAGLTHLYGDLPDPYYATFGKSAAQAGDANDAILVGNEYLSERDLVAFAQRQPHDVRTRFGEEFMKEFARSPRSIFDSLPRDQKLVVMRMASTEGPQPRNASAA
jgi:hypothetical protein